MKKPIEYLKERMKNRKVHLMKKNFKILTSFFLVMLIISCQKKEMSPKTAMENMDNKRIKAGVMAKVNTMDFVSVTSSSDIVSLTSTNEVDPNQPIPYYAFYGSSDSTSLMILAYGEMLSEGIGSYAKMLLSINRFKGADTYLMNDGSSAAVLSVVDTNNNLFHYSTGDLPNNGNVTINYFDQEANTISGTFEFTAISNGNLLVVKNGVFKSVKIN